MIKVNDPRYWNPFNTPWQDGSRAERAIPPGHVPTLLEQRGLTPELVDAQGAAWIAELREIVVKGRERRIGVAV